jgi:hypothetical protein
MMDKISLDDGAASYVPAAGFSLKGEWKPIAKVENTCTRYTS